MATSSTSLPLSGIENYRLFSYASKSEDNYKITTIIENYLAPTPEMEMFGDAIRFMPDVIRLHQLTRGTYSLATRYPTPTFTYLKLLREFAIRVFCQDFMEQPIPEALQDKSDIEWPCRDEVLKTCDIAYGRLLITLITERFTVHPKINTNKYSSMHIAVISGDAELVKHMIEQRCPLNLKDSADYSPLHIAVNNSSENVQLLVDARANMETVDKRGMTPLTLAAYDGNLQAVRILFAAGANIEHVDNDGKTPLLRAASRSGDISSRIESYAATIKALIDAGAFINRTDKFKTTPLMLTLKGGSVKAASYLISRSDVNMQDSMGMTALMQASANCPCLIDSLIKKGARVNLQTPSTRMTALFFAVSRGKEESVKSLLAAKADPTIVDSYGKRAIDYANGNARIIVMLTAPRSV